MTAWHTFVTHGFADLVDNLPDIEPCQVCGMADALLCICSRPDDVDRCRWCNALIVEGDAYARPVDSHYCDEYCYSEDVRDV